MRRIPGPPYALAALAVVVVSGVLLYIDGGKGEQPQAQAPSTTQASPQLLTHLPEGMGPQVIHGFHIPMPIVAARMDGRTFRYVLQDHWPARFLEGQVSGFLYEFGFGEKGRPMVVRLLDGEGRLAWAAKYDGVQKMSVRARPQLRGCGPIGYAKGRLLPSAAGNGDRPSCQWPPRTVIGHTTVLR